MSLTKANSAESLLLIQIGGNGTEFLFGTGAFTDKRYQALIIHEDAVFTLLEDSTDTDLKVDLLFAANTLKAGTIVKAKEGKSIKDITLASGSVIGIL